MSYPATVFNIMVGGPSDTSKYLSAILEAVHDWNDSHSETQGKILNPLHWATHTLATLGASAQGSINDYTLTKADILLAIFETRIGSPTPDDISGTVEEINRFRLAGKPIFVFFSASSGADPMRINPGQLSKLQSFRRQCETHGLILDFTSPADLKSKVLRQLSKLMNETPGARSQKESDSSPENRPLSKAAYELAVRACEVNGDIKHLFASQGNEIIAGQLRVDQAADKRKYADYLSGLRQLVKTGYVEMVSENLYQLTSEGYGLADGYDEAPPPGSILF